MFKSLLGSKEFGGCFCAVWTSFDKDWNARCQDKSQPNFFITKKNIEDNKHVGFLVYQNDALIGWTGSGPKTSFPHLEIKLASRLTNFSEKIWSIGCLALKEQYRGLGLGEKIIEAVVNEARKNKANSIEAYPVTPFHEPRIFRGTFNLYSRLGFKEIGSERDDEYEIKLMSFLF